VTGVGGRYDAELQMFCPAVSEPDLERLRFLRWLAEQGELEHEVSGPPQGRYAEGSPAD
jgi:hypothetical protein